MPRRTTASTAEEPPPDRPRRCLHLLTRLNVGGPAALVAALAQGLAPEFDIRVAAGRPPDTEGRANLTGIETVHVPLVRAFRPVQDARALWSARCLITARQPPDLLHTHMAKAGALGRLAALSIRPRPVLVHTYHGHVLSGYFSPWQQRAFLEVERTLARCTDALVAVSKQIRDELADLGVGKAERWHVIVPGIELTPFLAVPPPDVPRTEPGPLRRLVGLDAKVPLVGAVGRLAPVKDHATLLRAFAEVLGAHLVLVGDGELRGTLEADARRLGLSERVHFAGWVNDIPAVLADLDVVALSSRNEGTPLALMEAAAAARPIVATAVGGVPDVVENGRTGLLVPPQSPHLLADSLRLLLRQPERQVELGHAARAQARKRFGADRMVAETADLYRELLASRASSR